MRGDALVFGVAGMLFGVIVGWLIGTQQAPGSRAVAAPVAQSAPAQTPAAAGGQQAAPSMSSGRILTNGESPTLPVARCRSTTTIYKMSRDGSATTWPFSIFGGAMNSFVTI